MGEKIVKLKSVLRAFIPTYYEGLQVKSKCPISKLVSFSLFKSLMSGKDCLNCEGSGWHYWEQEYCRPNQSNFEDTHACRRFPLGNEVGSSQCDAECVSSGFLFAETKDISS